ncbi:hypothetical protein C8F04DRAFT_1253866 [Mycena alexandri]|uniref:Uncharacterized protein n=1 Tax=Mycena alexandri TaxID=1745969 RepID=A0AAD6XCT4_9AGAR|nr:hypothetical protein C8F04DRAFT_1253866 [Mycena alexandri]
MDLVTSAIPGQASTRRARRLRASSPYNGQAQPPTGLPPDVTWRPLKSDRAGAPLAPDHHHPSSTEKTTPVPPSAFRRRFSAPPTKIRRARRVPQRNSQANKQWQPARTLGIGQGVVTNFWLTNARRGDTSGETRLPPSCRPRSLRRRKFHDTASKLYRGCNQLKMHDIIVPWPLRLVLNETEEPEAVAERVPDDDDVLMTLILATLLYRVYLLPRVVPPSQYSGLSVASLTKYIFYDVPEICCPYTLWFRSQMYPYAAIFLHPSCRLKFLYFM